jgi:hypothetical protein
MRRAWTADEAKAIQAAARADWETGNVNKEFTEKQGERGVSDKDVERTLKSNSTLICRYTHHGQPRFGFWHPQVRTWIAWQPAEAGLPSELKSCITDIKDGFAYGRRRDDFELVRREKR